MKGGKLVEKAWSTFQIKPVLTWAGESGDNDDPGCLGADSKVSYQLSLFRCQHMQALHHQKLSEGSADSFRGMHNNCNGCELSNILAPHVLSHHQIMSRWLRSELERSAHDQTP